MSAQGQSSSHSSSAAVLEFICLFTHDLRRKQKRWQDGRLKYHTFNQRVMVYDERGNSVGDMHWRRDYDFGEGEEVELERGGVIVQVCDIQRRTDQDLSELLDKRAKEKEQRQERAAARTPASGVTLSRSLAHPVMNANSHAHLHRPLHMALETPSRHGKVSAFKDFDERHAPAGMPDERVTKRRMYEPPPRKSGYSEALFGQTLTLSATSTSSAPASRRAARNPPSSSIEKARKRNVDTEEVKPAMKTQSTISIKFDQPPKISPSFTSESSTNRAMYSSNKEEDRPQDFLGKSRPPVRKWNTSRSGLLDPVDDEVIAIEDPEPIFFDDRYRPMVRKSSAQPTASTGSLPSVNLSSVGQAGQRDVGSRQKKRLDKNDDQPDAGNRWIKAKKPKQQGAAIKANTKRTLDELGSPAKKFRGIDHASFPEKRPGPVTEFRIKSRKKRGLLMLSHPIGKCSPERDSGELVPKSLLPHHILTVNSGEDGTDAFRLPNLPHVPEEPSETDGSFGNPRPQTSIRCEVSAELRKDKPLSFCSPNSEGRTAVAGDQPMKERTEDARDALIVEQDGRALKRAPAEPLTEDHIDHAELKDGIRLEGKHQVVTEDCQDDHEKSFEWDRANLSVPPQGTIYDPHQLPVSSFEEESCLGPDSRGDPNPKITTTQRTAASVEPLTSVVALARANTQRRSRRQVALGDEGAGLKPQEQAGGVFRVFETVNPGPNSELLVPVNKAKKALKFLYKKPQKCHSVNGEEVCNKPIKNAQSAAGIQIQRNKRKSDVEEPGSNAKFQDEFPTKRQRSKARPVGSDSDPEDEQSPRRQRNLRPKATSSGLNIEEEQITKHLEFARKTREQKMGGEEVSPPTQQGDSGLEAPSRKLKMKKITDERPHLAKMKNSVKSRELIGIDLSAFDMPPGLRGIGMPFSILSSPMAEPVHQRIENRASTDMSSGLSVVEDGARPAAFTSKSLETIDEAEEARDKAGVRVAENEGRNPRPDTAADDLSESHAKSEQRDFGSQGSSKLSTFSRNASQGHVLKGLNVSKRVADSTPTSAGHVVLVKVPRGEQRLSPVADKMPTSHRELRNREGTESPLGSLSAVLEPSSVVVAGTKPRTSVSSGVSVDTAALLQTVRVNANRVVSDPAEDESDLPQAPLQTDNVKESVNHGESQQQHSDEPMTGVESKLLQGMQAADALNRTDDSTGRLAKPKVPRHQQQLLCALLVNEPMGGTGLSPPLEASSPSNIEPATAAAVGSGPGIKSMENGTDTAGEGPQTSHRPGPGFATVPPTLRARPRSLGLHRSVPITRGIPNISIEPPKAQVNTKVTARIANPASRGRKAALQSDAAGPSPQRLLPPTQPRALVSTSAANFAATQSEDKPTMQEPEKQKPKRTMQFPGFQSARGEGPWSREAFDLLGSGKPQ